MTLEESAIPCIVPPAETMSDTLAAAGTPPAEQGPLHGVRLCLTGFDLTDREEVAGTVQRLGGTFFSQLERGKCTHLLVADDSPDDTPKLVAARRWGSIAVVPLAWLRACSLANARVPETSYLLEPLVQQPPSSGGMPPSAAPKQQPSARERSFRAENTVLDRELAGGLGSKQQLAELSWNTPPAWDALHLSGTCILFESLGDGDGQDRCVLAQDHNRGVANTRDSHSAVYARLREAAWRGGATVVTEAAMATHVVTLTPQAKRPIRAEQTAGGPVYVSVDWLLNKGGETASLPEPRMNVCDAMA